MSPSKISLLQSSISFSSNTGYNRQEKMCTCVHTHISVSINTYIHTHTHIYVYIYLVALPRKFLLTCWCGSS
jgi:uncharacterized membrane protein YbaN (DUF454 family)